MSNAKLTGIRLAGVLLLFAWAGSPAEEKADSEDYESPISASDDLGIGADLGTEDAKFSGNPLGSLISNWPPDLVVAPVPGRSPQVGWNLAVAAGYFLTPKDDGSKVPPSLVGAYGFIAENGSNVYGGGVKLNLLDDKLRLVAGAGYADVRYRLYGIGRAQGDTGFGVDILQEGPAYFAKLQWRMFGNFYAGLGYLGGRIDTRLRLGLPDHLLTRHYLWMWAPSPFRWKSTVAITSTSRATAGCGKQIRVSTGSRSAVTLTPRYSS